MKVALYCNAPVLLAADIDRGGIFAALVGTMELLEARRRSESKRLSSTNFAVMSHYLGQDWIGLKPAPGFRSLAWFPFYHDIHIAEEDSLALEKRQEMKNRQDFDLDIAVIALPHIANFDDFDPFEREARVRLRYVEAGDKLRPTRFDYYSGQQNHGGRSRLSPSSGREQRDIARGFAGVPIIGICAGYQMLGAPSTIRTDRVYVLR